MQEIKDERRACGTLFVSDLDGTLLDRDARLTKQNAEKINDLLKKGVNITFATARTVRSVSHILGEVDFSSPSAAPVALMNGVLVRDMKSGKYVSSAIIPWDKVVSIARVLDECGAEPFVYTLKDTLYDGDVLHTYYRRVINPAMQKFLDQRVERYNKHFTVVDSFDELFGDDVVYFCILGDEEIVRTAHERMQGIEGIHFAYYADSYEAGTYYLEVFGENASKAHAVEFLRAYTGAERVVCFGDNLNDLPMFDVSDIGVAVSGAVDAVKAVADHICDNVPDFIAEFCAENGII